MSFPGKYVPEPPDEYKEMKQYLESMNLYEDGLSINEMKDLTKTLKGSLQGNFSRKQDDWDEDVRYLIDYYDNKEKENCAGNLASAESEDKILLVEVDVHHAEDWDPEEDLAQKMKIISMNEGRNQRLASNSSSVPAGPLDAIVSAVDPKAKKALKRKKEESFFS